MSDDISDLIKKEKEENDILSTMGHDRDYKAFPKQQTKEEAERTRFVLEKALKELIEKFNSK